MDFWNTMVVSLLVIEEYLLDRKSLLTIRDTVSARFPWSKLMNQKQKQNQILKWSFRKMRVTQKRELLGNRSRWDQECQRLIRSQDAGL